MKNYRWLLLVLFLLVISGLAPAQSTVPQAFDQGQELFTNPGPWKMALAPAATSGTTALDLTATDLCFYAYLAGSSTDQATVKATIEAAYTAGTGEIDVWKTLGWGVNVVELAFFTGSAATAGDAADDYFGFELYAWADSSPFGPGVPVCVTGTSACKVGTMKLAYLPYGSTATAILSGGAWVDTIAITDCWGGVTIVDSGTDNGRICRLIVDLRGYRYLKLRTFGAAGATKAANIGAIIRRY